MFKTKSNRAIVALTGADTHSRIDLPGKNLSVTDFAGEGRFLDGVHYGFREFIGNDRFHFYFREKIDNVFRAFVDLGTAFLASEAADFRDRHTFNAQFSQGFDHIVQLERLDDRLNFRHSPCARFFPLNIETSRGVKKYLLWMRAPMDPHRFHVVLIEPEIGANTGNIGRTCVGLDAKLHLVGKLGFSITDRRLKRAGLDYWPHLDFVHHPTWDDWWSTVPDPSRVFFFSTKASKTLFQTEFRPGDWLVFGKETKGLDEAILEKFSASLRRIPMTGPIRSLNIATAVAVVLFEGFRQLDSLPPGE